jgi:hypothetical protein
VRMARIALASTRATGEHIGIFDEQPVIMAAASDPDVMRHIRPHGAPRPRLHARGRTSRSPRHARNLAGHRRLHRRISRCALLPPQHDPPPPAATRNRDRPPTPRPSRHRRPLPRARRRTRLPATGRYAGARAWLPAELHRLGSPFATTGGIASTRKGGVSRWLLSGRWCSLRAPAAANHRDPVMLARLTDRNAAGVLWTKVPARLDARFVVSRCVSSLPTDRPSSHLLRREQA